MSYISKKQLSIPIGSHGECEEFQVGATIIWVYTNNSLGKEKSIEKANRHFNEFWNNKGKAILFAESESRKLFPDSWKKHDNLKISENPLSVWGIWYYPDIDKSHYDVNINHNYPYEEGTPEFEEESIIVERNSNGKFCIW